jgi:hypothetical protein
MKKMKQKKNISSKLTQVINILSKYKYPFIENIFPQDTNVTGLEQYLKSPWT